MQRAIKIFSNQRLFSEEMRRFGTESLPEPYSPFQKRTIPPIIGIIDRKGAFALPNRVTGSKKDIPIHLLAEAQLLRQGIKSYGRLFLPAITLLSDKSQL